MEIQYFLFFILLMGCGYSSYKIGMKEGAANTVDILHSLKIISYNERGDITPYRKS